MQKPWMMQMTALKFPMLTSPAGPAAGADEPGGDDAADPAAAPTVAAAAAARTEDRRALGEQGRKAEFRQSSLVIS